MADNITVPGTGEVLAWDERTINSVAAKVQRVVDQGGTAIASGQVVPTTTAATLLAARDTRKAVTFYNGLNVSIWVGPATVTTANGLEVPAGAAYSPPTTALLQVIIAAGGPTLTGVLSYLEIYDA